MWAVVNLCFLSFNLSVNLVLFGLISSGGMLQLIDLEETKSNFKNFALYHAYSYD